MKIYGANDDLLEIEGDELREEFNILDKAEHGVVVAVSNGALLRVRLEKDGIWRITSLAQGHNGAVLRIHRAESITPPPGRESYSDVAELFTGSELVPFEWVAIVRKIKRRKRDRVVAEENSRS